MLLSADSDFAKIRSEHRQPQKRTNRATRRARGFNAAEVSDALASWTTSTTSPDELVFRSLKVLRARSRQLADNTDLGASYIRLCQNHIIGFQGFRYDPRARDKGGKLDTEANQALKRAWLAWGEDTHCDYRDKLDEKMFDELVLRTVAIDGEVFIEEMAGKKDGISFALHDPDLVPVEYNVPRSKGQNLIRFGIEYDERDRPVKYYFRDRSGSVTFLGLDNRNMKLRAVPADKITHVFVPIKVGLRRGFPWMTPGMIRFRMLSTFEDAALRNANVGAAKLGILSGPGASDVADAVDDTGVKIIDNEYMTLYETDAEVQFHTFDTKFPSTEYSPFIKTNSMFLSAGVGVNYNSLTGDLSGVNYSSLKHGTTEERETWKSLQRWLITDWKRKQHKKWLKIALLLGIPIKNTTLRPQDLAKYSEFKFHGRRWDDPDALKRSTSETIDINNRVRSPQDIIRDRGRDPEEVFEELRAFYERMRELGIPLEVGGQIINVSLENSESDSKDQ